MVDSDGYTSTIFDGRFDGFDLIVFVIVFSIFMCGFLLLFLLQYVSKHYCYDPENEDEVREEMEKRLAHLFDLHEEIEIQLFHDYDCIQQNCALTAKHCQGIKEWLGVPMHV